jgi:hypothetical protein
MKTLLLNARKKYAEKRNNGIYGQTYRVVWKNNSRYTA